MSELGLVSVVIPTRGRPALLRRALDSVRSQTFQDWEAVVVVDGPDPDSEEMLAAYPDPRVRHVVNPATLGGAEARNVGARHAAGTWVALLDDDDEWLPEKLELQLETVVETGTTSPLAYTSVIVRRPGGDEVWPTRPLRDGEPVSEYLFARRSLSAGEGAMHTSSLLVSRASFLAHPFDASLPRFQDTDWVLRLVAAGATPLFSAAPLVIRHMDDDRTGIRREHAASWELTLEWIRRRRSLVTPRAYAAFLLIRGGQAAAAARSGRGGWTVLTEAVRQGRPHPVHLAIFAGKWLVPRGARGWFRRSRRATRLRAE